jgi:FlaA1/EpsC-like NDP-sugar epimerase
MIVRDTARLTGNAFVAVRFGNVLGSRGSVVNTFKEQIEQGGPITVTHPDMTRFFMTIPEAVHLVLQASGEGKGGDLFVLDMGEPVKIVDLAEQMIRLSGKDADAVGIDFVGARPGEKLHEELWGSGESVSPTAHPKIRRVSGPVIDAVWLDDELTGLERCVEDGETLEVVSRLSAMIRDPRYALPAEAPGHVLEDTLH